MNRFVSAALGLLVAAHVSSAQRVDSARVAPRAAGIDTIKSRKVIPPLSPGRAFTYSLLMPGLAQSKLNRPLAGGIFVFSETIGIAMLRESAADLSVARRFRTDSVSSIGRDPVTGELVTRQEAYTDRLINVRKGHVEDWVAFLVGNHLFAAADAYVAAHLWDLPAQFTATPAPDGGTRIGARIRL